MAYLFLEKKSRFVQILEVVLVSVGMIWSVGVMKDAVLPYSCDALMSGLTCIRCFLSMSSPPTIIIILMVALILASSATHPHHHELLTTLLDLDLHLHIDEPPLAPPPRIIDQPRDLAYADDHESLLLPPPPRTRNQHHHEINTTPSSSQDIWKDVFVLNASENEDDTMEAMWKAIAGGGEQKPKKKHLTKSETVGVEEEEEVLPKWKELRKAETFNDAVSVMRRGGLIRREEPSMSMEEFNHKVEAFIKNFNNDMRLQRQQSQQRFLKEKINHCY